MKKHLLYISSVILLSLGACHKDLPTELEFESYQYASLDEDGGEWSPVLISAGSELEIPVPAETSSSAYQSELAMTKSAIQNMTAAQKENLTRWTNNPVVRWNEIALELIAKYNLIPGPNADGTYTLPNPATPEGPPGFPFAHPPYASRALAYLSVAQFDGLIAAWHYKYLYNRPAAYQVDSSIPFAYIKQEIPAYPSDGAVIASSSRKILTAMFPLEAAYLEQKEKEHLESLLLSGEFVSSDVEAGSKIGNDIAAKALARASTDGMKNAQTSKAVSDSIANAAFERFGWKWVNLESPQRPVGLTPLFGKVKMWNVPNVEATRPGMPPVPGSEEYEADVKMLKDYAAKRTLEHRKIANFWQDGLGTYTPPGHWNDFANRFIVKYKMSTLRAARTLAYMNMAIMDGGISCWDAKYYYHYPRPIQQIDGFETIAGTPNFPSYTSGHSVFSAAASEVLAYIFPNEASMVRAWAEEAAVSRVYGGIHWSFDATVGTQQGRNVAQYSINRAASDGAD
ncbi:phosphatase PAP2 family protein [Algoriphagus aestuariicola]|uniref:Phosphatase PAP2 family protein n=1 Tax=Algoriphagus aestuariicola TaxID=1852016 RepID=A0ABS3BUB7_9BACT|nr:phosphatase PAP2 family protein [Algoriphagus aestuariicola]MBN7802672.1 phosphatase PAP2 family protein [Algoriphagus aestuariicola]